MPDHPAARLLTTPPPTTMTHPTPELPIYSVTAIDRKGWFRTHLVGAATVQTAIDSVLAADPRLLRAVRVMPADL